MITETSSARLDGLIADEQWDAVAAELSPSHEPGDVWLRLFSRNLDALRAHRPALYEMVTQALDEGSVALAACASRDADADRYALQAFDAIDRLRQTGQSVAIAGLGDGSLLHAMAKFPPQLQLGRQQEVMLIEPDLGSLIAGLGCVDLSGPKGPIEQPRITWYVGEGWAEALTADLLAEPTKMFPQQTLTASLEPRSEVNRGLDTVSDRITSAMEAHRASLSAYYEGLDDADLLAAFGPNPPRQPRVLMLTSQFTAVLQYSTYDSADAMRQLGWDVRICTETKMWHAMSKPAIAAAIAEYKPDLVFQIDHLRYELGDLIPANLPFVCWIQDHLTNLTSETAGASITDRDFVLTGGVYRYVSRYAYPRQQCIDMPKVSRAPTLPTTWTCDRDDLFYVSHWSQTPDSIIFETVNRIREIAGPTAELAMRDCATELVRIYGEGGSLRIDLEVRRLVREVFARRQMESAPETERFFVDVLFQRLNNAFYRQQSLRWAGQIADELGLKFGIYGNGWEKHPELGRFARGVVKYGPELEDLTRRSKILLQLEPYACYTHQRMLDALLAGGFALIREHPLNHLPIKVRQFLDAYVPAEVNSVPEAREALCPALREAFDALLVEARPIADLGDVVDVIRGWQRAGIIGDGNEALPHLNAIAFDDFETLRTRVKQFIGADDERQRIASDQRRAVIDRLTYVSALGRAMGEMYRRLGASIRSRKTVTWQEAA